MWFKWPAADPENFGGVDDKIDKHKLCIISKFWMCMMNDSAIIFSELWGDLKENKKVFTE